MLNESPPDAEGPWPDNSTKTPVRLDAHDVANRIMRKENYLIALFNKDVLDISIPSPAKLFSRYLTSDPDSEVTYAHPSTALTRTLQWSLERCLLGFMFGPDGRLRREVLSERDTNKLSARWVVRL